MPRLTFAPRNRAARPATVALALVLAVAAPAEGQDTLAPQPSAPQTGAGEAAVPVVPEQGESYLVNTYQDWALRCVRIEQIEDPCEISQSLSDDGEVQTAEVNVFTLPERPDVAAGATIVTPLNTLLPRGITLAVDGASGKRYPFTFCNQVGCVAQIGLTAEEVDAMKRGNTAVLSLVPVAAPDQTIDLPVSLAGFTAGFDALSERAQPPRTVRQQ